MTDWNKQRETENGDTNHEVKPTYYHSSMPKQHYSNQNNNSSQPVDPSQLHSDYNQTRHSPTMSQDNPNPYQAGNPYQKYINNQSGPGGKPSILNTLSVIIAFPILHHLVLNLAFFIVAGISLFVRQTGQNAIDFNDIESLLPFLESSALQNYASILMALILIPVYLVYLRNRRNKYRVAFIPQKSKGIPFSTSLIAIFGSLGLVTLYMFLLELIGRNIFFIDSWLSEYEDLANMIVSDDTSIVLQIFGTVIFVPIVEELLFRGIVQGQLDLVMPPKLVVIVQAILFGAFHLNPIQGTYTIIPGLILGIAYYQTKNLLVPIIGHMVFNFFGGMIYFIAPEHLISLLSMIQIIVGIFTLIYIIYFFANKNIKNVYDRRVLQEQFAWPSDYKQEQNINNNQYR